MLAWLLAWLPRWLSRWLMTGLSRWSSRGLHRWLDRRLACRSSQGLSRWLRRRLERRLACGLQSGLIAWLFSYLNYRAAGPARSRSVCVCVCGPRAPALTPPPPHRWRHSATSRCWPRRWCPHSLGTHSTPQPPASDPNTHSRARAPRPALLTRDDAESLAGRAAWACRHSCSGWALGGGLVRAGSACRSCNADYRCLALEHRHHLYAALSAQIPDV